MKKIIFALTLLLTLPAHADEFEKRALLTNGTGEVEVAVDNVSLNLNINSRDKDIKKAKAENEKKYQTVLEIITKKHGLSKDSIKSNFVSANPSYVPCYPTPERPALKCDQTKIDFYDVNRSLEVKLEDLTKYDALITDLTANATSVYTGQYGVTEMGKHKDEARNLAIDAAKAKAQKIANRLGVKLGKPLRFEAYDDAVNNTPRPQLMKAAMSEAAYDGGAPTDTATMGKIKVTISVNIAYEME